MVVVERNKAVGTEGKNGVELSGAVIEFLGALLNQGFQTQPVVFQFNLNCLALRDVALRDQSEGLVAPGDAAHRHFGDVGVAVLAPVHGFIEVALRRHVVEHGLQLFRAVPGVPVADVPVIQLVDAVAQHGRAFGIGLKDLAVVVQDDDTIALVLEQGAPA